MKRMVLTKPCVINTMAGRQTQDRRICKDDYVFSLTTDRVYGIYTGKLIGESNEIGFEENTSGSSEGLQGWLGRTYLLMFEIQKNWEMGVRGMVSVKRKRRATIHNDNYGQKREEGIERDSCVGMFGFSRLKAKEVRAGQTFRWKPQEQQARQFEMGNSDGKLSGQGGTRKGVRFRGKTSTGKTKGFGIRACEVGGKEWLVQPASCSSCLRNDAGWNISYSSPQINQQRYVAEGYEIISPLMPYHMFTVKYLADGKMAQMRLVEDEYKLWENRKFPYRPTSGRFMYKSLARTFMKITEVRIEQVQDISEEDAIAEGIETNRCNGAKCRRDFAMLWDSIHGDGAWERNDWVWVNVWGEISSS